jgi:uncharacterized protein YbjT (DUF2867 family)
MAATPEHGPGEVQRLVTVFGGTGFLGRRVVRHLLDHGFAVRVASRHPERVAAAFASDRPGLQAASADIGDTGSIAASLEGAYGAVNAVSLYVEKGEATFQAVHVEGAGRVARVAHENGVGRLVHVSGIGADADSSSPYIKARGRGELAVREAFATATIVRPAVMFGPDDAFLTTLVGLLRRLPVYPMFGKGETRLQPVYVEDVGEAIARLLGDSGQVAGPGYEFGGPGIYTYRELLSSVADRIGARTRMLAMPFAAWEALAGVAERLPGAPLTRNQIALMRRDNVASKELPGLPDLGITPTALEDVAQEIATGR